MKTLFLFLGIYLAINLGVLVLGIAIGYLLHWIVRGVDLGTGILTGVVLTEFSIHFFSRFILFMKNFEDNQEEPPRGFPSYYSFGPLPSPRKRKKKGT